MPGRCRLCAVVNSPFITSVDRLCGFDEEGRFRSKNFGCGVLETLRGLALFSLTAQVGDEYVRLAPVSHADRFVLLVWADQSHRIDHAFEVLAGAAFVMNPLTLAFAEEVIASKSPRRRPELLR
jgi:hypothetical protein